MLPGGKTIVVDAKAPLDAFPRRGRGATRMNAGCPIDHARRAITSASWRQVVLGAVRARPPRRALPGEMIFSAALEHDPTLIEEAFTERRSPPRRPWWRCSSVRLPLWRTALNARRIAEEARALYDRVIRRAPRPHRQGPETAVKAHNEAAGLFTLGVVPQGAGSRSCRPRNGSKRRVKSVALRALGAGEPAEEAAPARLRTP
jgi:DNA recombination protein RmuC